MAKYAISHEGINAMSQMCSSLNLAVNMIVADATNCLNKVQGMDGLGIYQNLLIEEFEEMAGHYDVHCHDISILITLISNKITQMETILNSGFGDITVRGVGEICDSDEVRNREVDQHVSNLLEIMKGEDKINRDITNLRNQIVQGGGFTRAETKKILDDIREAETLKLHERVYGTPEGSCAKVVYKMSQNFTDAGWNSLNEMQRKNVLSSFSDELATSLRIDKPPVYFTELEDNNLGYYDRENNSITINSKYVVSNYSRHKEAAINTVIHEMRHAHQWKAANAANPNIHNVSRDKARIWRENFHKYISSKKDYPGYYRQAVEVDARSFAAGVLKKANGANGGL